MSLTVRQLNADSTFLLTFAPPFAPSTYKGKFPGSFTILIDPWLHGASVIGHPKFATNQHSQPSAIRSLAELKDIDLIIISQEKSDHLHKESLCSLPHDAEIRILATPKAAKEIEKWDYFKHDIVRPLQPYNAARDSTLVRIPIDPYSSASAEGEVTIANITEKRDITGLHNAIGITYCPPGSILTCPDGSTIRISDLPSMSSARPRTATSPSDSPSSPQSSRSSRQRYLRGSLDDVEYTKLPARRNAGLHDGDEAAPPIMATIRTDSPMRPPNARPSTSGGSRPPTVHTIEKRQENREKVLSVLYTPHGIDPVKLRSYIAQHLYGLALPLTALFHSMNVESNPKWMGGLISAGAPGGIKLAKELEAKYWVGAHDEVKDKSGVAIRLLKGKHYDVAATTKMLRDVEGVGQGRAIGTEVCVLGCGGERRFSG